MFGRYYETERPGRRRDQKLVSETRFLRNVREQFQIKKIYYPGCGDDFDLLNAFKPGEVVHVDTEMRNVPRYWRREGGYYLAADYTKNPFGAQVFDAIYIQDVHLELSEINEVLKTLKNDGIVIFSLDDCMDGDMRDLSRLRKTPELREIRLPYYNRDLVPFQKKV